MAELTTAKVTKFWKMFILRCKHQNRIPFYFFFLTQYSYPPLIQTFGRGKSIKYRKKKIMFIVCFPELQFYKTHLQVNDNVNVLPSTLSLGEKNTVDNNNN